MTVRFGQIEIDPIELASQGNAVLGIRDSGKSYTATALAELMFDAGIPFIAFDPIGVWRNMRVPGKGKGYPIVVAGGEDPDIPLTPANAAMIVEAAMQNRVSLVLDLFDMKMSKADWRRIVRDCVHLLLHRNRDHGLRHIFIEEAAEFVPQSIQDGLVYAEMEKLARMGGNAGLGYTLINQRAQEVNKAVLELCDNLFLHRQKGKNALDSLKKWLDVAGAVSPGVIASLPTLPQGVCWAWMSGSDTPIRLDVPTKNSLHPDRRITHADAGALKRKAVPVSRFVEQLQKALPELEKAKKDADPAHLRAEIKRLEAQIGRAPVPQAVQERLSALQADNEALKRENHQLSASFAQAERVISRVEAALSSKSWSEIDRRVKAGEVPKKEPLVERFFSPLSGTSADDAGKVPSGCSKPLAALAGAYPAGMTESQWGMVAGYKIKGGTWGEYRRRLLRAGMVEDRDGLWYATEIGAQAAGDVEGPPPPGPELARWWAKKAQCPDKVVNALLEAHPRHLARAELAEAVGMEAGGGSFGEYVRRLVRNKVAWSEDGAVGLTDMIMGEG